MPAERYHGSPCKKGGHTERYTSSGGCVACTAAHSKHRKRERKGKTGIKQSELPCKKCGSKERYVSSSACVPCARNRFKGLTGKVQGSQCKKCGGTERYARSLSCVACMRVNSKGHKSKWYLIRTYGITPQEYDLMLLVQGGGCALCGGRCGTGRELAVDHDHETGTVRGLLCQACNTGIGKLRDDPALLRAAADYIAQHKQAAPGNEQ